MGIFANAYCECSDVCLYLNGFGLTLNTILYFPMGEENKTQK